MSLNAPLIQSTFAKITLEQDDFIDNFYSTLFQRYGVVKPLFDGVDMSSQKQKLVSTLALVVNNIESPDAFTPIIEELGSRHVGYGAEDGYYDAVGECLLYAIETTLGDDWNSEVERAWTEAYTVVADIMKQGAQSQLAKTGT